MKNFETIVIFLLLAIVFAAGYMVYIQSQQLLNIQRVEKEIDTMYQTFKGLEPVIKKLEAMF